MGQQALRDALERLRTEVRQIKAADPEAELRLEEIINDAEAAMAHPDDHERHQDLVDTTRDAVEEFETKHPRATAILNEIMMTLSNMGI